MSEDCITYFELRSFFDFDLLDSRLKRDLPDFFDNLLLRLLDLEIISRMAFSTSLSSACR